MCQPIRRSGDCFTLLLSQRPLRPLPCGSLLSTPSECAWPTTIITPIQTFLSAGTLSSASTAPNSRSSCLYADNRLATRSSLSVFTQFITTIALYASYDQKRLEYLHHRIFVPMNHMGPFSRYCEVEHCRLCFRESWECTGDSIQTIFIPSLQEA